jgi:hypothetical protein
MKMSESEYSCYLGILARLRAQNPPSGSREGQRLEVCLFLVRLYESEHGLLSGAAETGPPDEARTLELLRNVFDPPAKPAAAREGSGPALLGGAVSARGSVFYRRAEGAW